MKLFKHFLYCILLCFGFLQCTQNPELSVDEQRARMQEPLIKVNKELVKKDQEAIKKWLERRNDSMTETKTGLWYKVLFEGKGKKAEVGKRAIIKYKISLLDGKVCYSSDSLGTKEFRIGKGGVENGLEEGILLLSEGSNARFVMPPHLAYGLVGDDMKIPPRSIIVYDVEVLHILD